MLVPNWRAYLRLLPVRHMIWGGGFAGAMGRARFRRRHRVHNIAGVAALGHCRKWEAR